MEGSTSPCVSLFKEIEFIWLWVHCLKHKLKTLCRRFWNYSITFLGKEWYHYNVNSLRVVGNIVQCTSKLLENKFTCVIYAFRCIPRFGESSYFSILEYFHFWQSMMLKILGLNIWKSSRVRLIKSFNRLIEWI